MVYRIFSTSGTYSGTAANLDAASDIYGAYVMRGVSIGVESGAGIAGSAGHYDIINDGGSIVAQGSGIYAYGGYNKVTLEAGSLVRSLSYFGLLLGGDNNTVVNRGTVIGGDGNGTSITAVSFSADSAASVSSFTNTGLVSTGYNYAIQHSGLGVLKISNAGTIQSDLASLYTIGDGVELFTNSGKVVGAMSFGLGNDLLNSTGGSVQGNIDMGGGADTVYGSAGADVVLGGTENDLVCGNAGKDILDGGDGTGDVLDYREKTVAVQVTLKGAIATSVLVNGAAEDTVANFERVLGGGGGDKLVGDGLGNQLSGNAGNDILSGAAGKDMLAGGLGNDTLTGGTNPDSFRFDTAPSASNFDLIKDFSHADDTILMENAIFAALGSATGPINPSVFLSRASGHDATTTSQKIVYDQSNGQLWYDPTGSSNGSTDAKQFATLTTHPANVDYTDFSIV